MKALVENTFSSGVTHHLVDGQMMSTLRQILLPSFPLLTAAANHLPVIRERHISATGCGLPDDDESVPRRKLTLMSNPLMAPNIPFNRRQESLMNTMKATVSLPRGSSLGTPAKTPLQHSQTKREEEKFTSLSTFLSGGEGSKYMKDSVFASALATMMTRAKKIDSARNSSRKLA